MLNEKSLMNSTQTHQKHFYDQTVKNELFFKEKKKAVKSSKDLMKHDYARHQNSL